MSLNRPEERLKAARIAAGFVTAATFAATHDIKVVTYQAHERGEDNGGRRMPKAVIERYATALGERLSHITADWLRFGSGEPPLEVVRDAAAAPDTDTGPGALQDRGHAFTPHPAAQAGPTADGDRALLRTIMATVDKFLDDGGLDIAPDKRIDLYFAILDLETERREASPGDGTADNVIDLARYQSMIHLAS